MSTNLKLGNLVTPKGASLIFGAEATDNFLDIKTTNDETYQPYTIVIEEEDGEEIIPAEQISYATGNAEGALTSTTAQGAIGELNNKINTAKSELNSEIHTTKTDIDYLNEHAFGLTKFFDGILDSSTWETVSGDGDSILSYAGITGLSFADEFAPIQDGLANPNYKLRAKLILNDSILTWMQENKIPKLLLMQKQSTAEFALTWPAETMQSPPTPIGISVDVLKDNALSYEAFACDSTYYIVDAVGGGGGAAGGSFVVTYGETTIADVKAAVEENLTVTLLVDGNLYAPLTYADLDNDKFVFTLELDNLNNPQAVGSKVVYTLDSTGYSYTTHTGFVANLHKDSNTPNTADAGYIRPIRVSGNIPTDGDGNVGDLWVVIGG